MEITYGPELRFVPPPGDPFEQLLPTSGLFAKLLGKLVPLLPQAVINWRIKRLLLTWQHPENSLFDDGAILINADGCRFCTETDSPAREIAISEQRFFEVWIFTGFMYFVVCFSLATVFNRMERRMASGRR